MANIADLTGRRSGKLVALHELQKRGKHGNILWHCVCDCGNECDIRATDLRRGAVKSCGCLRQGRTQYDLVGRRFGMLTVIAKEDNRRASYGTYGLWRCKCDCGNETIVLTGNLISGKSRSCGCAHNGRPASDLAGKRFGKLLVVERIENYRSPSGAVHARWKCICDCGNECFRTTGSLYNSCSCGCSIRIHLDGNNKNNADDNIRIVSRGIAMALFKKKLISSNPEITDAAIKLCELEAKIRSKE